MADYERLGALYLGRSYDLDAGRVGDELLLYDAKDLTTHAVCVGMTGSGKTGLAITMLEEAAIDGIPSIAIDPKGDLGNLLLTFPDLEPADFRPWIDEGEAARKGHTPEEHARWTAQLWRKGLADWGQDGARVARFRGAVDTAVYTPGSRAGLPLAILRSFAAPAPAVAGNEDALRERIQVAVSGLLSLLGITADPLRSREHILLSTLLDRAWRDGRDLDLASLIREIQAPPFERVGVVDLESFFAAKDRFELAMLLNNLIASPSFDAWTEGDPLDVGRMLYTAAGKPRLSIVSIAHLSESERMFFVTLLLNEVLAWVRAQRGSRSLRALLYMDEVFGYFPPTANPPSKTPMLTLLKQARAYGLGVVLATQNPVDLDYKGLSNAGTWFLGRLQTERDKARVIEGLEGVSAAAGSRFDRPRMERILAGLGSRVFLMNNVHEDEPVIFHSRWALSYLAGPLTREQIRTLTEAREPEGSVPAGIKERADRPRAPAAQQAAPVVDATADAARPVVPPEIREGFLPATRPAAADEQMIYRPTLLSVATVHYANARAGVDEWETLSLLAPLDDSNAASPWEAAVELGRKRIEVNAEPEAGARFATLPPAASRASSYKRWEKMLVTHLYRTRPLRLWHCRQLRTTARAGESEGEFRGRLRDLLREQRDLQLEKLRDRYAPKLARLQERIRRAEERVRREQSQYKQQKVQTAISVGATLLGALFGRKLRSVRTVGSATTAMRGAGRAARERYDIERATENVRTLQQQLADLEAELEQELDQVREENAFEHLECKEKTIAPKKSELSVDSLMLAWTPWTLNRDGIAEVAY
jgi:hypothetical protein